MGMRWDDNGMTMTQKTFVHKSDGNVNLGLNPIRNIP